MQGTAVIISAQATMDQLGAQIESLAPKFISGALVFILFWAGGAIAYRVLRNVRKRKYPNQEMLRLVEKATHAAFLVVGGVSALGTMGVNVTALVASLGLTGFALGFALRDAAANMVSGVLIIMNKTLSRGDHIAVLGVEGEVSRINLRYTILEAEGKRYFVPNAKIFDSVVTVSFPPVREKKKE